MQESRPPPNGEGRKPGKTEDPDITVPDFRGMQALDAWLAGHEIGLLLQGPDPDGPQPLTHGRVVGQHPFPGTRVPRWSVVTVTLRDDPGNAGVREPRRPIPPAGAIGAEALPEAP
ncbi:PASTA domain-containing protein [Rhizohabitans arisaemae]|uniref:PASTA domain-containing protein n=1 Tax=Rhizohabitans arisaemae TaxID=2720610 RepID=UPI0024B0B44D|nr:PASTA domain-containing protein [Rhizohabitans arisaemae]